VPPEPSNTNLAHAIQPAVAPVFLLTEVGALALMVVATMPALIIGLPSFLREIFLATDSAYLSSR